MPRSEIAKAKERANYQDRKHRLSASKVMHELQQQYGAEYCLCCSADLPKSHFLWKKEQTKKLKK